MRPNFIFLFKIILKGAARTGKSAFLSQLVKNETILEYRATIGVEFATKTVKLADKGSVKAQIWDTGKLP